MKFLVHTAFSEMKEELESMEYKLWQKCVSNSQYCIFKIHDYSTSWSMIYGEFLNYCNSQIHDFIIVNENHQFYK